jgi:hypothetical protein
VATVDDSLATATYGRRHVFAPLDARTMGLAARADVAFHPDLSLQLYLQPFGAVARYGRLGELRAPRRFAFRPYGVEGGSTVARDEAGAYVVDPDGARPAAPFTIGDPDLAYRTVNGTAVLRWEYRPGAALYAVWTQRRATGAGAAGFDAGDLRAAFAVAPENVLLLKASVRWAR